MSKIAIRGYTQKVKKSKSNESYNSDTKHKSKHSYNYDNTPLRHDRVLVFDTETTTDEYYNLNIGFFKIYQNGYIQHEGLFYTSINLADTEEETLKGYADRHNIALYTLYEFIEAVFYPEVFGFRTLCVGFNLPFDISRISKRKGDSRKQNKGGFTLTLSDNRFNPPIIIKKMGEGHKFTFTSTKINKGEYYFSGHFLDAKTLAEALLKIDHISLAKAGEKLNTRIRKMENIEHGKVTNRYIDYLIQDVETTYEVYEKLVDELDIYGINIPLTKIYSSASIGKYALKQLGLESFLNLNPNFPSDILGNIS